MLRFMCAPPHNIALDRFGAFAPLRVALIVLWLMKFGISDCGGKESRRQAYLRGILSAFGDGGIRDSLAVLRPAPIAIPLLFIPAIHILELLALAVLSNPNH